MGTPLSGRSAHLDAITRTAQYVAGLSSDAGLWGELCRVLTTFFHTDIAAFAGRRPDGTLLVYHAAGGRPSGRLLSACRTLIGQVMDNGFLAAEVVELDGPCAVAVLPIQAAGRTDVMIVGHARAKPLGRDLLNLYLAVADLLQTALARLTSQHLLIRLADNVPGMLFQLLVYPDGQRRFTYVNRGAAQVLGMPRDALLRDAEGFFGRLDPENRRRCDAALRATPDSPAPVAVDLVWAGVGEEVRYVVLKAAPHWPGDGTVGWDGAVEDVTAVRCAEAERARQAERLKAALLQTVHAVSLMLEKRDPYTAGHQRQVAELAVRIARELRLPEERIEGLHVGGLIHDIGKIAVPSELLAKPTALTPVELELIRQHAEAGYEIIRPVAFPWPVAEMILQHHERLDGSGYPHGLAGDAIILEARILAVVDAMTSHRPYRPRRGLRSALAEIRRGAGSVYDPAVAAACVRVLQPDHDVRRGTRAHRLSANHRGLLH